MVSAEIDVSISGAISVHLRGGLAPTITELVVSPLTSQANPRRATLGGDRVVACAPHPDAISASATTPRAALLVAARRKYACTRPYLRGRPLKLKIAVPIAWAAVVVAVTVTGGRALRDSTGA